MLGAAHGLANPLDGALRHRARPGGRPDAAARDPVQCQLGSPRRYWRNLLEQLRRAWSVGGRRARRTRRGGDDGLASLVTSFARPAGPAHAAGRLRRGGIRPAGPGRRGSPAMDDVVQSAPGRRCGAVGPLPPGILIESCMDHRIPTWRCENATASGCCRPTFVTIMSLMLCCTWCAADDAFRTGCARMPGRCFAATPIPRAWPRANCRPPGTGLGIQGEGRRLRIDAR